MFEKCDLPYDGDLAEHYGRGIRIAETKLQCYECGCDIEIGQKYEKTVAKWDGRWDTISTCLICSKVWDDLFNGYKIHGGLTEYIYECYGEDFLTEPPESSGDPMDEED